MSYPISLDQKAKQEQKTVQRLMMTPQMQQAIHLLQMPVLELSQAIAIEMEQNPVLEYIQDDQEEEEEEDSLEEPKKEEDSEKECEFEENQLDKLLQLDEEYQDFFNESGSFVSRRTAEEEKYKAFLENSIQDHPTLCDYLMEQAREAFSDPQDLSIAEILVGYLDEQGFLTTSLEEISTCFSLPVSKIRAVLDVFKGFDPVGIASKNVQEVLLRQLAVRGKSKSLAYKIIEKYFDDLLHNRLPQIQKALKVSAQKIHEVIQNEIANLELHPGAAFAHSEAQTLVPDAALRQDGDLFVADVNEEFVHPIRLNREYLKMLEDKSVPDESKEFIKSKIVSGKWLMRNLHQRNETITKIANYLGKKQKEFFLGGTGTLTPLTMREVAAELELHESTIARAVADKYIDTPRGIYPFRFFFSNAYTSEKGDDVSSKTVRNLVAQIINEEDKKKPLSDEAISKQVQSMGITCARRTVTKYRKELRVGTAQQRRRF
jgi:RNA polymerase sigma-54 factor